MISPPLLGVYLKTTDVILIEDLKIELSTDDCIRVSTIKQSLKI